MKKFVLVLIAALAIHSHAQAGNWSSSGGQGVACYNGDQLISVESFDLFEGRVMKGYSYEHSDKDAIEIAKERARELDGVGHSIDPSQVEDLFEMFKLLPDNVQLRPIDDADATIVPRGCKIVQLAAYTIRRELFIDGIYWRKMDNLNKAALILHEAVYESHRMWGKKTSLLARQIVALAFSDQRMISPVETLEMAEPEAVSWCQVIDEESSLPKVFFWMYRAKATNRMVLQFLYLDGLMVPVRTIAHTGLTKSFIDGIDAFTIVGLESQIFGGRFLFFQPDDNPDDHIHGYVFEEASLTSKKWPFTCGKAN